MQEAQSISDEIISEYINLYLDAKKASYLNNKLLTK